MKINQYPIAKQLNNEDLILLETLIGTKTANIKQLINFFTPEKIGAQPKGDYAPAGEYATKADLTPKVYDAYGYILNGLDDTISGTGSAFVTVFGSLAKIEVALKINAESNASLNYHFGINRDALRDRNPNIPFIIPIGGGIATYYDSDGTSLSWLNNYGGTFSSSNGQFWAPSRVYQPGGAVGTWESSKFKNNMLIVGTCYGRVGE